MMVMHNTLNDMVKNDDHADLILPFHPPIHISLWAYMKEQWLLPYSDAHKETYVLIAA